LEIEDMQVTIPEAARMLRVSEHTVRRRLRSGELQGSQVASVGGFTWMVDIPDELLIGSPVSGETAVTAMLIARLEAQIASQEAQIAAQYEELEARRREVQELHVLLQQAQAALPSPKEERYLWWRRLWRH
jgi:helix-turn-helix protein